MRNALNKETLKVDKMKLLKQKKSFTLGFEQMIIIGIIIAFLVVFLLWQLHLRNQGGFILTDLFKR